MKLPEKLLDNQHNQPTRRNKNKSDACDVLARSHTVGSWASSRMAPQRARVETAALGLHSEYESLLVKRPTSFVDIFAGFSFKGRSNGKEKQS